MAKRSPESFVKRQREMEKKRKNEQKRARRQERSADDTPVEDEVIRLDDMFDQAREDAGER